MRIPRVIEAELAEDWTSPWTGTTFSKGEAKVFLESELTDSKHGTCLVSLPNPVPAYLALVNESLSTAISLRTAMFKGKTQFPDNKGSPIFTNIDSNCFDQYFQVTSALTAFSFMALEAWCNQVIPEDYLYTQSKSFKWFRFIKRKKTLDKTNIERWVSLDIKIKEILPDIFSKPHFKGDILWQRYKQASKMRNEFIHLKSPVCLGKHKTNYDPFFQRVLDANLDSIAKVPKDIMTYFIPEKLGF